MMNCKLVTLYCVGVVAMAFVGCEIITQPEPAPQLRPANNVVINEVFLLPPTNPNYFFWIEFYNPTNTRVDISKWTLGFKTSRLVVAYDSTGIPIFATSDTIPTYRDVPLRVLRNHSIGASGFQTIVSDIDRMQNYTDWVGDLDPVEVGESLVMPMDTVRADSIVLIIYSLFLTESEQLVLKDTLGNVVDVVRYGNYVYSGGPDPYPGNQSLGAIVPFQSFSRYAGAYTSGADRNAGLGNTAADFFITGASPYERTTPTPQWLNQGYKR